MRMGCQNVKITDCLLEPYDYVTESEQFFAQKCTNAEFVK